MLHLDHHWLRRGRLAGRHKIRTPVFSERRISDSTIPVKLGRLVSRFLFRGRRWLLAAVSRSTTPGVDACFH